MKKDEDGCASDLSVYLGTTTSRATDITFLRGKDAPERPRARNRGRVRHQHERAPRKYRSTPFPPDKQLNTGSIEGGETEGWKRRRTHHTFSYITLQTRGAPRGSPREGQRSWYKGTLHFFITLETPQQDGHATMPARTMLEKQHHLTESLSILRMDQQEKLRRQTGKR